MKSNDASILIVDDERCCARFSPRGSIPFASQLFSAENGAQAMQIMAAHRIDLIVTDIRMPVMDGITLLKRVKESLAHTCPAIIFISGFTDISTRQAYDLGVEAFLEKLIDRDDLIHFVQQSLAERTDLWRTPPKLGTYPDLTGNF